MLSWLQTAGWRFFVHYPPPKKKLFMSANSGPGFSSDVTLTFHFSPSIYVKRFVSRKWVWTLDPYFQDLGNPFENGGGLHSSHVWICDSSKWVWKSRF